MAHPRCHIWLVSVGPWIKHQTKSTRREQIGSKSVRWNKNEVGWVNWSWFERKWNWKDCLFDRPSKLLSWLLWLNVRLTKRNLVPPLLILANRMRCSGGEGWTRRDWASVGGGGTKFRYGQANLRSHTKHALNTCQSVRANLATTASSFLFMQSR